ncbi:MAG: rhomboid family intramembrane serine protease [Spirochaetales bacterium]
MRIRYNAPVTLNFTLLAFVILLSDTLFRTGFIVNLFSIPGKGGFQFSNPYHYIRLFTHVLGHLHWAHFLGNFALLLLLGPILEEKYGSGGLFFMMLVTAFITGLLNVLFLPTGLLGASGIVFMMIILVSFANIRQGEIPITFILVLIIYLAGEVIRSFQNNNISEFAHIVGGACGSIFGFVKPSRGKSSNSKV